MGLLNMLIRSLWDVTIALCAQMLVSGGLVANIDEGHTMATNACQSGAAAERFAAMVSALGGPSDLIERPEKHLPTAPIVRAVLPAAEGSVLSVKTRDVGLAVVGMGGGRVRAADPIDSVVGFTNLAMIGDSLAPDEPLGFVHARDEAQADRATQALLDAYTLGPARDVRDSPTIIERITA